MLHHTTDPLIVDIQKIGFSKTVSRYKEAFELALTKVNEATKNVLKEAKLDGIKFNGSTLHNIFLSVVDPY